MYFSLAEVLMKKGEVQLHERILQKHLLSYHVIQARSSSGS